MGRRRSIFDANQADGRHVFDVTGGAASARAVATAPPSMPPIRWDYETPRPPREVQRPTGVEPATPRPRPARARLGPLVSAAAGGAVLALGCSAILLAALWLGGA